jgi:transcriptional regulator with XRE-family HTH domain
MPTFGSRLRKVREAAKLSQEGLAAVCRNRKGEGVSRTAVSYWESDQERPSFENLVAIAQKLKVSIDYLVGFTPEVKGIGKDAIALAQQWEAMPADARKQVADYLDWVRRMEATERKDYRAIIDNIIKSSKIR